MKVDLRREAKDRPCQARIPNHCNGNSETVVLGHANKKSMFGAGMGSKVPDIFGGYICSGCHDVIDGRSTTTWTENQILVWFYEAIFRTQNILLNENKLKIGE